MSSALAFVREHVRTAESPGYVLAVNSEKAYALLVNPQMREFFDKAVLLIPDGIGLVLAVRMLFGKKIGRVPGADLMQQICREAPRMGYKIFIYGATEDVNRRSVEELRRRY